MRTKQRGQLIWVTVPLALQRPISVALTPAFNPTSHRQVATHETTFSHEPLVHAPSSMPLLTRHAHVFGHGRLREMPSSLAIRVMYQAFRLKLPDTLSDTSVSSFLSSREPCWLLALGNLLGTIWRRHLSSADAFPAAIPCPI